jgi:MraZ protein
MYFIGNDIYSVDHKGRVFIPAKFRAVLTEEDEGSFYIVRGFETSLLLFPLSGWDEFVGGFADKRYSQKSVREAIRAFSYAAERLSMDSQGRVVLPGALRDYSKIEDEVFFLGAINKIELWSPSVYEEYSKGSEGIDELYSKLGM